MSGSYSPMTVWRVTVWKDGAVYDTETVATVWFPMNELLKGKERENLLAEDCGGEYLASLSTSHKYDGAIKRRENIPEGERIWENGEVIVV